MARIRVGRGRSAVTIEGPDAAEIEQTIRRILGPVADEIQAEADRIIEEEIRPNWPQDSGRSLDGFTTALQLDPGEFRVSVAIINEVPYIRFIRSTKVGTDDNATRLRSPIVAHVRRPVRAAERALGRRLVEILEKHLSREMNR